ncbi:MAG: hypothetical protein K0S65_6565, partial [Labilithrix sp.]|nr:hypothetical protein [Labilithrix sp.]
MGVERADAVAAGVADGVGFATDADGGAVATGAERVVAVSFTADVAVAVPGETGTAFSGARQTFAATTPSPTRTPTPMPSATRAIGALTERGFWVIASGTVSVTAKLGTELDP